MFTADCRLFMVMTVDLCVAGTKSVRISNQEELICVIRSG